MSLKNTLLTKRRNVRSHFLKCAAHLLLFPTNIAEGCGRNSNPDFKRFLTIATGSSPELEYQLILSRDLKYLSEPAFKELENELIEIRKMIHAFSTNIK
jgi:four helix bundle protein